MANVMNNRDNFFFVVPLVVAEMHVLGGQRIRTSERAQRQLICTKHVGLGLYAILNYVVVVVVVVV